MFLFGLLVNDPHRVGDALAPARPIFRVPTPGRRVGWGLGYYDGPEVLFNKRPHHTGTHVDFYDLAARKRTNALLGHVRQATVGELREENTHPFRLKSWLFAHNGTLRGFGDYRARIDLELPGHFGRLRPGDTDSERLFHLFMAYLGERAARFDDPNQRLGALVEALRRTLARVDALAASVGAGDAGPLAIVLTNGRLMLGAARGLPLLALTRSDSPTHPGESTALKSVLLVSADGLDLQSLETAPPGAGWQAVPDASIVAVDRNFVPSFHPLASQAI